MGKFDFTENEEPVLLCPICSREKWSCDCEFDDLVDLEYYKYEICEGD
jgi:hypothetical protein